MGLFRGWAGSTYLISGSAPHYNYYELYASTILALKFLSRPSFFCYEQPTISVTDKNMALIQTSLEVPLLTDFQS